MQDKLPHRKQLRLKEYDYSAEGYYFITICTQNRKNILSKVVGVAPLGDPQTINTKPNANIVGVAAFGDPEIKLTTEGKIVKKYIENYNKKFDNISIDEYIIMPNHIHIIINLKRVAQGCDPYNTKNSKCV